MSNAHVNNPACESLKIYEWQLKATGDNVSASLLAYLQPLHTPSLEIEQDEPMPEWQSHTMAELVKGVLGAGGANSVRHAIRTLENLGFISTKPGEKFDHTKRFRLNVPAINLWIKNNY